MVARRRPFRLMTVVASVSLIAGTLAVLGFAPSAYAAGSSTTVVAPNNPTIVLGAANTASATVTGDDVSGSPTQSVSFYVCGPSPSPTACTSTGDQVGSAVTVSPATSDTSTATSASFTPTATGTWCFAAVYSGDTNYTTSSDTTTDGCFDVTSASTSTVSTPTTSSIVLGASNTDLATVTGNAAAGSPTETVSFYVCGPTSSPAPCASTDDQVGTAVTVVPGASDTSTATSASFTPTATGTWCFAAVYSGDSNYTTSSDGSTDECFDVTPLSSSTVESPTTSSIVLGGSNTDGAVVTGDATGGDPTQTVSFYVCGPTSSPAPCASTDDQVGTAVTVAPGAGDTASATSASFTPTSAGTWCFAAVYSGDTNYSTSSDTTTDGCFDVTAATSSTTSTPSSSTVVLGASPHDAATVTGNATGGSPTGTVSFYQCGPTPTPTPCTSVSDQVGHAVTVTAGPHDTSTATSASFRPTGLGYWCFAAVYAASTNYQTSADSTTDECFNVTQASSATTTVPANSTITLGEAGNDAATVTGNAGGGSPTGTVTFYECGPTSAATACTSTADPVGAPVTLTAGTRDTATATSAPFTPSAVGYWCFAGRYSGSTDYAASSDTLVKECIDVKGSLVVVTPSLPNAVKGRSYSTTLTARGGTAPYKWGHTGTLPHGILLSTAGVLSGTSTVSGSFPIVVKVSDSSDPRQFAQKNMTLVVDAMTIATSTVSTPTSSSIVLGGTDADGAKVTGNATGGTPTGTVTFYECGPTSVPTACTTPSKKLGTANLVAGTHDTATAKSASFTPRSTGYWCFAADYSGNLNYDPSADAATAECFNVTAAATSTVTSPTNATVVLGHSDSDGATVTGNAAGGSPTGTVSFYVCGATSVPTPCTSLADPIGTAVTVTTGAGHTSSAASGSFTPTATGYWCFAGYYSGDTNYNASTDATTDECFDVTAARTTTVTVPTNLTITLGQTDNDSATVTGNAAGGNPTGTVTFYQCGPASAAAPCTSTSAKVGRPIVLSPGSGNTSTATSASFKPNAVGYWCFAAAYSGDSNYSASSDTLAKECIDVTGPPSIITTSLPHGTKGKAYSTTLAARGGTMPYTWGHTGTFPPGMGFNTTTGVLSGTPAKSGSYTVTFKLTDSGKPRLTATKTLTLVIAA